MQILTLLPGLKTLRYAVFSGRPTRPQKSGIIGDYRGALPCRMALDKIPATPDVIGVRVRFGGTEFRGSVVADGDVLQRLETLTPAAPLHLPAVIELVNQCATRFPGVPQVLTFDTAFFADLPARERLYALDDKLIRAHGLQRFGYCGLMHAAAWQRAAQKGASRVISLCLEPRPELTAIQNGRPLYVTSGATPVEGLPGQTTCGDLDPGLVVLLAEELGWGAERLNTFLTRESGLKGLTGRAMTFDELFAGRNRAYALARDVIRYRLLLACGMSLAAMGGVDAMVISGRHVAAGQALARWLKRQAVFQRLKKPVAVFRLRATVEQLVAEQALLFGGERLREAAA